MSAGSGERACCAWPNAPTHKVCALRTLVFPAADIQQPPTGCTVARSAGRGQRAPNDRFAVTANRWIHSRCGIFPLSRCTISDVVCGRREVSRYAISLGGKTSFGVDCSGLVQVSLNACGIPCLRDSDMQERNIGARIDAIVNDLHRGDLFSGKAMLRFARDKNHDHSRQRISHGGRDRAGGGSGCTHSDDRFRGHKREAG